MAVESLVFGFHKKSFSNFSRFFRNEKGIAHEYSRYRQWRS